MDFKAIIDPKARNSSGCAVVGIFEDGDLGVAARQLDAQMGGMLGKLHGAGDLSGKLGDTLLLARPPGAAAERVLIVGLGARAGFGRKQYRKSLQSAVTALLKTGARNAAVYLPLEEPADLDVQYRARFVVEALFTQAYRIPDLKTGNKPKPVHLTAVKVAVADAKALKSAERGIDIGTAVASGLKFSRDLANLPPNLCTPTYIGSRAQQLARDWPSIRTKVLGAAQIKALKMGAFMAVTRGSA